MHGVKWSVIAAAGLGCAGCVDHTPAPGELMVEVSTDMSLPKDIDTIRVQILSNGQTLNDQSYAVGPSNLHVPATIGILAGSDSTATALVRLTAIHDNQAIILREATSEVPPDRIALLDLPLEFLCEGSALDTPASGSASDPTTDTISEATCPQGDTCVEGACQPAAVNVATLPTYAPPTGEGESAGDAAASGGTCFDTTACFASGSAVAVDTSNCTVALASGAAAASLNVALQTTDGQGICGGASGAQPPCFVPIDEDPSEGWQLQGDTVQLPPGLCDALGNGLQASVVVSSDCPSKTSSVPPCGPWSSATTPEMLADGGEPIEDAGAGDGGSSTPFVGTWACTLTITDAEDDGGSNVGSETATIAAGDGGEIAVSAFAPDSGFYCATAWFTTGDTATLAPNQSCTLSNGQYVAYESGTATVSGNTLTLTGTIVTGDGSFGPHTISDQCTRQSVNGGSAVEADGSTDATLADGGSFACVQPADPAPLVQDTISCAAPPTPAGGTMVDGTYYLTSAVEYVDDAGCSQSLSGQSQGTIVVEGGEFSAVVVNGENPPGTNGGWEIGTTPTLLDGGGGTTIFGTSCICGTFSSCSDGGDGSPATTYTATPTTIMAFPSANGVFTFTKQ